MSTISAPLTDSRIMLRRNLKHILRNPVTIFNGALMPVVLMLLFVYVFGNAFNVGEHYVEYATPGLILLAITYGLAGTAVSVSSDMTKGIINRFKVMNVSRGAVLTGHVVATMLSSSVAIAVIIGMAFALGFRSPATPLDWLAAIGIVAAAAFAAAWLTVALGMAAKTPESAGLDRRAADPAAVREQRDRAGRQDGTGCPAICGVSALHADYRIVAWIARRHPVGRLRGRRSRLVRRDRPRRVPVVACHVQQASVASTSSRQLACVPSRVASANRASPRRCRAICSIRATSGWERSGSPRTPALAASSRAACSYWSRA